MTITTIEPRSPLAHEHGPDHDQEPFEPLDPAQQSLVDSLRWAFLLLKLAMLFVFVIYCFTGTFRVSAQERAVRLRFGKIVGAPGEQVFGEGLHFGWPYPIEETVRVPIDPRSVLVRQAFWFQVNERDQAKRLDDLAGRARPLNPEVDGSLLTGDANIVHGKFRVTYRIDDPAAYVRNVGNLALADQIVGNVTEQGIVYAVAQVRADEFVKGRFGDQTAIKHMQRVLNEIGTGIKIEVLSLTDPTVPLAVRDAFKLVIDADNEKVRLIEEARQTRTTILNETAGEAHKALFELVQEYQLARAVGEFDRAESLNRELDEVFDRGHLPTHRGGALVGGEVARTIGEAKTARTQVVEQIKAEVNHFRSLLNAYQDAQDVLKHRLWQSARAQIFTGDVETFYMDGIIYVVTNPDPNIKRQREIKRLTKDQERAREQSNR